ncbi:MDR family MFS transporter [Aeromicrobium sp. Root344]|uniref:MDR family MFS transporter n=1 Tax=Aeromicrobium sp. Root344 TaxID=1736521 RepID=UPI000B1C4AA9|nr:MDR family MFS transporter [Aeromicrobium sp. Root344]
MTTTAGMPTDASESGPLEQHVVAVAAVVVLGAVMTVLDSTIVSVAIDTLGRDFGSPLATIQWVMTGYMLALAAVIPLTGWAAARFGGKQVWLFSLALFIGASALCATAWSIESLIAFRVLQGLGGGMVMPVGMTLVAQAAGPQRMGRAMSIVGIPMMLGPVLGPVVGGLVVSNVSWRWMFVLNIPLGLVAFWLSTRVIERKPSLRAERLDVVGLSVLTPGVVAFVYGLSVLAERGGLDEVRAWVAVVAGAALIATFVRHALRVDKPLLDLRLFANRTFTLAVTIQVLLGAVLIGSMLLLPLYYQVVRGESASTTGLLLVPQGVGAALAMAVTGRLADRGKARLAVLTGLPLMVAGLAGYTASTAGTSYVVMSAALLVIGIGTGCVMAPVMATAYAKLDRAAMPGATATLNVTQRIGGAIGTAIFAAVLQHQLSRARSGGADLVEATADAFGSTFWWPLAPAALAIVPAVFLPRSPRPASGDGR